MGAKVGYIPRGRRLDCTFSFIPGFFCPICPFFLSVFFLKILCYYLVLLPSLTCLFHPFDGLIIFRLMKNDANVKIGDSQRRIPSLGTPGKLQQRVFRNFLTTSQVMCLIGLHFGVVFIL